MTTRVFLIHGWGGSPDNDWFPWAIAELKSRGYEVIAPLMPDTNHPQIDAWVTKLAELVGSPLPTDIFVGHSIGTQTILRFLQSIPNRVGKVILVAPWLTLTNLENEKAWKVADPWLRAPMDFVQIKPKSSEFVTVFSDNDIWVPYAENKRLFVERLNPQVITLHNLGHFTVEDGVTKLPQLKHLF